jgi:hypothetical protein
MDDISKMGDINSVNDFFDFKLSIKTIIIFVCGWGFLCLVIVVFMLGGVNNTVKYALNILDTMKTTIVDIKNKNVSKNIVVNDKNTDDKNTDDKKNDDI